MMAVQAQHARSVRTRDGIVCQCSESVWMDSPLLQNSAESDSTPFDVDCDKDTWFDLEVAHREGLFPTEYRDLYKLLEVSVQLQLENLIRLGLKHLFENPCYWKYHYPADLPDEVVFLCVRASLRCLFRTEDVYRHVVREILSLSRSYELNESILNEINSKLEEFTELGLERVPIYFDIPCVPIVITKHQGKPRTTIVSGENLKSFDLFGKNFDLTTVNIDAFHLKYASYLLYKSGSQVYYKDLRRFTPARRMLGSCKYFISRKYTVLAVTRTCSGSRVWMWIGNGKYGGNFKIIHTSSDAIKSVDSEPEGTLLILKENGSLSTAELSDNGLMVREHQGKYHSAFFFEDNLYALSLKEGKSDEFNVHCFWRVAPSQWEGFSEFDGRQTLEKFAEGSIVTSIGGKLFRFSQSGLEMNSPSGSPHLLLRREEFVAFSELHLHP